MNRLCILIATIAAGALAGCMGANHPPVAAISPTIRDVQGETFTDNYAWLKDRGDPRTLPYLEAENAYTASTMAHTKALQKRLYNEILSRVQEDDTSAPYRDNGWWYYARTTKGKDYAVNCRRKDTLSAPEEIILDGNALAANHDYFALGVASVSDDGRRLAYSIDNDGGEKFTLHFKDLSTGRDERDEIKGTYYGGAWSADGSIFFYTTTDAAMRPSRVYRHTLGTPASADALVFEEKDELFTVSVNRSRNPRFILIELESNAANEWWSIPAADPAQPPRLIAQRRPNIEYQVEAGPDRFYIMTNESAPNFRVVQSAFETAGEAAWNAVIPARENVTIEGIEAFAHHLVIFERENGLVRVRVRRYDGSSDQNITFPDAAYDVGAGDNAEFDARTLRINYESPVTPPKVIDIDMESLQQTLVKQDHVPNFDASRYEVERVFAPAPDGKQVPITVLHRKGFERDGSAPGLLKAYGSYGFSNDPGFDIDALPFVDRGMIVALAHVRGGADMGRGWYEDGRLFHKKNTFTDFIACAEYLQRERYIGPQRLAIRGGSAGGLLMGAVANMRPDLFKIVVAEVPFVDVINTMLDPTIPLTITEYEQWGNPNKAPDYTYMRSYSPYDNVQAKAYPSMFVRAGLNDPRVGYWEPAKWVAKLRALKTDSNTILLSTDMGAGHGGASGRYESIKEEAMIQAFILDSLTPPAR